MMDTEMRHQRYAVIAAVCATAILAIALFNRTRSTGPCTYNSFQRSAVCVELSELPGTVPSNTQVLDLTRLELRLCCSFSGATSNVVLDARPWLQGASRRNFCGLSLGLESCIDNILASPSNSCKIINYYQL